MTDTPHKGKILLVDDDKFLVDMYSMKFTQEGYDVTACLSVDDAVEALKGGFMPNAVLFDIVMPVNDGFAFLQMMRDQKLATDAIKIALTNQGDEIEQKKATELGASRYIIKATMIPSEVVNIVGEEISKRAAH